MNTDQRCKNCKWWKESPDGSHMVCDKVGNIPATIELATSFSLEATAADDQGLEAWLVTGPDFGCVQFDPKQA